MRTVISAHCDMRGDLCMCGLPLPLPRLSICLLSDRKTHRVPAQPCRGATVRAGLTLRLRKGFSGCKVSLQPCSEAPGLFFAHNSLDARVLASLILDYICI